MNNLTTRDRCLILHGAIEGIGEVADVFRECAKGAKLAAEEAQRAAMRDGELQMVDWEGGFLAGLIAADLFVEKVLSLRDGLRRQYEVERERYLRERGMADAENN